MIHSLISTIKPPERTVTSRKYGVLYPGGIYHLQCSCQTQPVVNGIEVLNINELFVTTSSIYVDVKTRYCCLQGPLLKNR